MSEEEPNREAAPMTNVLQTAFSAENHESLDSRLTALMIQLSVETPPHAQLAPPRERGLVASSIRRMLTFRAFR
jgi:hypothetical protein